MKEQLLETWQINNRMTLLLLDNITESGLQKTLSTRSGRTVYQQLVHVHNVRMQWLEIGSKDIFKKYEILSARLNHSDGDKDSKPDRDSLRKAIAGSGKALEELLEQSWDNGGKVKGFKKGVLPLLGYFISHESHHRGNILLTLKQCGEKIPDSLKWGLWEWGK